MYFENDKLCRYLPIFMTLTLCLFSTSWTIDKCSRIPCYHTVDMNVCVCLLLFALSSQRVSCVPSNPVYPVTAALFGDRFSLGEWNDTIDQFKEIGGDTVWKEAPPLVRRSLKDLQNDPVFKNCVDNGTDCFTHAQQELTDKGLKILTFASYQNGETYGDAVLHCPQYSRKITTKNVTFYRIVLLADENW